MFQPFALFIFVTAVTGGLVQMMLSPGMWIYVFEQRD